MNLLNESEEREWSFLAARMIFNQDFWSKSEKVPGRIGFQRFGVQLREEDFEQQGTTYRGFLIRDRSALRKDSTGFSVVRNEDEKFSIDLDVWPFKWDELTAVVVPGLYLMIDGEHSKKCEDNSICTRKFTRRYLLPKGCLSKTMKASYTNFTLKITADKNENVAEFKIPRKLDITRGNPDEMVTLEALQQCRRVPIANDDLEIDDKTDEDILEALQLRRKVPIATEELKSNDKTSEDTLAALQQRREVPIAIEDLESNRMGENSTELSENSTDEDSTSDKAEKSAIAGSSNRPQ